MLHCGWRSSVFVFTIAAGAWPTRTLAQSRPAADVPPTDQRAILMELYEATSGPTWTARTGWGTDQPICQWAGVLCDFPPNGDAVVRIELAGNGLQGRVPPSIANLPHLRVLDLSGTTCAVPCRGR